jgi:hypothetical protein
VPASTHSKTAILSNGFIRKLVKFDYQYQQTQLQPDRLHHKIKINSDFMIEQPRCHGGRGAGTVRRKEEIQPRMDTDKHGFKKSEAKIKLPSFVLIRVNPWLKMLAENSPD